jgi:hypothetical protein
MLPSTLIIALLYKLYEFPIVGDYFPSLGGLFKVVRNTSTKHKFSFKVLYTKTRNAPGISAITRTARGV